MVSPADPVEKPRRFYRAAEVASVEGGYAVHLDGRTAKSPRGAPLTAPTRSLARLLADEWEAQSGHIDLASMPAVRLAFTTLDRAAEGREGMVEEVARYAGSDLLCYLAEEPQSLAEREAAVWGPWLSWADRTLGVALRPSIGIAPAAQDEASIARVRELALELDDFSLTGLVFAAGLYGSAVLALAALKGALPGPDAFELSRLDEAFQEERWGVDAEADARTERMRADAAMIDRWFAALRA